MELDFEKSKWRSWNRTRFAKLSSRFCCIKSQLNVDWQFWMCRDKTRERIRKVFFVVSIISSDIHADTHETRRRRPCCDVIGPRDRRSNTWCVIWRWRKAEKCILGRYSGTSFRLHAVTQATDSLLYKRYHMQNTRSDARQVFWTWVIIIGVDPL